LDIQQPILECARNVEKAVVLLKETMDILYKETDRARGWRKLVDATKTIGEQTSRLLVVIYGAEEKRLRRAGEAAKAALRKVFNHKIKEKSCLTCLFFVGSQACALDARRASPEAEDNGGRHW
jgi:hypothetical protein